MNFTIGSLFDGSGGFPLAAALSGGGAKWAAEIEPYPIAVTKSRFPKMKHLGNVMNIKGNEIEPVDVITFGSPCQDMSIAGKRAGLKHESKGDDETTRSGLFMEAVRIIREMRGATNNEYPRFAVWENVPGAFSSNKGEDFRIVLEELIKIVEPSATMPPVPKNGWPYADSYSGDGWSLAYRVFDAQYWGVPQRRRRIYLVIHFRGQCAREVLFERKGLRRYFTESGTPWKRVAADAENSTKTTGSIDEALITARSASESNIAPCLYAAYGTKWNGNSGAYNGENFVLERKANYAETEDYKKKCIAYSFDSLSSNSMKSSNPYSGCHKTETAKTLDCFDPSPAKNQGGIAILEPIAFAQNQRNEVRDLNGVAGALAAEPGMKQQTFVAEPITVGGLGFQKEVVATLLAECSGVEPTTVYCIQGNIIDRSNTANCNGEGWKKDIGYTLNTIDRHGITYQKTTGPLMANSHPGSYTGQDAFNDMLIAGLDCRNLVETKEHHQIYRQGSFAMYIEGGAGPKRASGGDCGGGTENLIVSNDIQYAVRRLTPTECARLQGFPDTWGIPDEKTELTDEEYEFWLKVRNDHAEINNKTVKKYTKDQMLNWYNKLHTDSSEYKLWGNGIALPNALYVMEGIADIFKRERD